RPLRRTRADARPGERELRLITSTGLTNPLVFCVGQLPEFSETAAKTAEESRPASASRYGQRAKGPKPEAEPTITLPATVNGQITPGDVDRYRFSARKGQQLVVAASARSLIPYLADAVPGWFQATLALYDADGKEVAYADDFRFKPDPVLHCEIPGDGEYVVEIKDAIYRGREDFVYRITVGELPYVTDVFPLGGPVGENTTVELHGWNLPVTTLAMNGKDGDPGIYPLSVHEDQQVSNSVPFAVDTLPECVEQEPNDPTEKAQSITLPITVNGRIDAPGDRDVFRFEGRAGQEIVAEIYARRLDSPLDSLLKLTDASGKQLALNDDHEDKGSGLNTHHADSWISFTLPADGVYYVTLDDAQQAGGPEYAYRLRISPPRPDFALRIVPSSVSVRNSATVPITVYAVRRDGFSDEIKLELKDAPEGFRLTGGLVPAGKDQASITLTVAPAEKPVTLHMEGRATINGQTVSHRAVPAEDLMQAFLYRHLVPVQEFEVAVLGRVPNRRFTKPASKPGSKPASKAASKVVLKVVDELPVRIPAGGTASVKLAASRAIYLGNVKLQLKNPPDGLDIQQVSSSRGSLQIVLHSDATKVEPGQRGKLTLSAASKKTNAAKSKAAGKQRRAALASLPTIPFVIIEP
ncbi:MAG: PPC domain-containing protein, partial [Planctomycetes bacterium]|nr:PPC domain-containing protein [Planctomycetota bacterium]